MSIKREIYNKSIAKNINRSFYSSGANLPSITPMGSIDSHNQGKIKDNIMDLKRKLIQKMYDIKELKLANSKLETSKNDFDKLYYQALDENNKSDRPIEECELISPTNFILSNESYTKLKMATTLSLLKHQISLVKKMTKEKDEEILKLLTDSKIAKLIERNNQLSEIKSNLILLSESIAVINLKTADQEKKTNEDIAARDTAKALYLAAKTEVDNSRDKLRCTNQQIERHIMSISSLEEKGKNILYKTNALRQSNKKKEYELNDKKGKVSSIEEIKEEMDKFFNLKIYQENEIEELAAENQKKTKEFREQEEKNKEILKTIDDHNSSLKKIRIIENNQFEVCKRDKQRFETEIYKLAKENARLQKIIPMLNISNDNDFQENSGENRMLMYKKVSNTNTFTYDSTQNKKKMSKVNKEISKPKVEGNGKNP